MYCPSTSMCQDSGVGVFHPREWTRILDWKKEEANNPPGAVGPVWLLRVKTWSCAASCRSSLWGFTPCFSSLLSQVSVPSDHIPSALLIQNVGGLKLDQIYIFVHNINRCVLITWFLYPIRHSSLSSLSCSLFLVLWPSSLRSLLLI